MAKRKKYQSTLILILFRNSTYINTALKDRRIIDDLINTLDFRNKLEIEVLDILSSIVSGLSESETESKRKIIFILAKHWFNPGRPIPV